MDQHHMNVESSTGDEVLLGCPEEGCGRRVVVQRGGRIVVLARGDFFALHSGGSGNVEILPPTAA